MRRSLFTDVGHLRAACSTPPLLSAANDTARRTIVELTASARQAPALNGTWTLASSAWRWRICETIRRLRARTRCGKLGARYWLPAG